MIGLFRVLQKWDYQAHEYRSIVVPIGWNCKLYTDNMDELVNCPHCGKELKFGETFTSEEIHNSAGMGYGVCEECYDHELERRKLYRGQEE